MSFGEIGNNNNARVVGGKAAFNERAKLTATYINGLAIAVIAAGGFSPLVLMLQGQTPNPNLGYFSMGCVALSLVLHVVARSMLKEVRD